MNIEHLKALYDRCRKPDLNHNPDMDQYRFFVEVHDAMPEIFAILKAFEASNNMINHEHTDSDFEFFHGRE